MIGELLKQEELARILQSADPAQVSKETAQQQAQLLLTNYQVVRKPVEQTGSVADAARRGFSGT